MNRSHGVSLMWLCVLLMASITNGTGQDVVCDADSDCFYMPTSLHDSLFYPALIVLSCTGATASDLDSITFIADSLHLVLTTCHESRNHREINSNDKDILKTYEKLIRDYPINPYRVFIYGFSGMGDQALFELFRHSQLFQGVISACSHRGAMNYARFDELADKRIFLLTGEDDWNLGDNKHMHEVFQYYGICDTLAITTGDHTPLTAQELYNACKWVVGDR